MRYLLLCGLSAVLAVGLVSCSQESRDQYGTAANHTGEAFDKDVRDSGRWAQQAAGQAGQAAERFSKQAEKTADNDQTSMSVKSALMSAKNLDTGRLRVDTNGTKITLTGSVPDDGQRSRAGQIAQEVAGSGYTVLNQLTINKD